METSSPVVSPDSPKCVNVQSHSPADNPGLSCLSHHSWLCLHTVSPNKPFLPINPELLFETSKKNAMKFLSLILRAEVLQRWGHKGQRVGFLTTQSLMSCKRSDI